MRFSLLRLVLIGAVAASPLQSNQKTTGTPHESLFVARGLASLLGRSAAAAVPPPHPIIEPKPIAHPDPINPPEPITNPDRVNNPDEPEPRLNPDEKPNTQKPGDKPDEPVRLGACSLGRRDDGIDEEELIELGLWV